MEKHSTTNTGEANFQKYLLSMQAHLKDIADDVKTRVLVLSSPKELSSEDSLILSNLHAQLIVETQPVPLISWYPITLLGNPNPCTVMSSQIQMRGQKEFLFFIHLHCFLTIGQGDNQVLLMMICEDKELQLTLHLCDESRKLTPSFLPLWLDQVLNKLRIDTL